MLRQKCTCVFAGLITIITTSTAGTSSNIKRDDRQMYSSFNNADKYKMEDQNSNNLNSLSNNFNSEDYSNYLTQQQQQQQQYPAYHEPFNMQEYQAAAASVSPTTDSSPALSALALLGFLYFLNLIENVLNNTNGRKRRDLQEINENQEQLNSMNLEKLPEILIGKQTEINNENESKRKPKFMDYLEDFFINLPYSIGIRSRNAEQIDRDGREKPDEVNDDPNGGVFTLVSSRLGMISSIMDFLKDPKPSRVKREDDIHTNPEDNFGFWNSIVDKTMNFTRDLAYEFREAASTIDSKTIMLFLQNMLEPVSTSNASPENHERIKRFTDSMNVWYKQLRGHNAPVNTDYLSKATNINGGGVVNLLGKVLHLMKNNISE